MKTQSLINSVSPIFDWLFPQHCVYCETQLSEPGICCVDCHSLLPTQSNCCRTCGQLLAAQHEYCGRCLSQPPPFDRCFCPFRYQYPINDSIRAFKYRQRPELARQLAMLLYQAIIDYDLELPDLLVAVPIHISKLRQRGFNQSWLLTKQLSSLLDIPCSYSLVEKVQATAPQAEQSLKARHANISGTFNIAEKPRVKHIAIIDDVVTTGATAGEITKILKRNGVDYVQVWGIAHTI